MERALNFQRTIITFGIPLLMIGLMVILAKSSLFSLNPNQLSLGISIDLLIIIPTVYYLLIRKTKVPKITILSIIVIGMLVGFLILPPQNQFYLNAFKNWVFPLLETAVLIYVSYQVILVIKKYKKHKNSSLDFYSTLKSTCEDILPKGAVIPVVTEIAVFYYGFINWKKPELKSHQYTYHKDNGTVILLITILFLVVIETFVFHILLVQWSKTFALILTFLSIYSGLQLFGFLKSILKRPISIEDGKLYLRYGIMNESIIEISNISAIEATSKDIEVDEKTRKLSALGNLESHNVIIYLNEENILFGLYGIKRRYQNLAFHVDDKDRFVSQINKEIQQFSIHQRN